MELYIRIKDDKPFEHPIMGDNFREAFPEIDVNNLPSEFMRFDKQDIEIGIYEVFEERPYFIDGDNVKNGIKRLMTAEEKEEKINNIKAIWAIVGFPSWVLNEATGEFEAPIPKPDNVRKYRWNEDIRNWVETA
jgi:hypothetical protein